MPRQRGVRRFLRPALFAAAAFFRHQRQRQAARMKALGAWQVILRELEDGVEDKDSSDEGPPVKRTRVVPPRPVYNKSCWAEMLRDPALADPGSKAAAKFRRRFRVPHPFFKELVKLVKRHKWLSTAKMDVSGRQCIPVELKVLASLHILGSGKFLGDICRLTRMSEPTICATVHKFCECFAKGLYAAHANLPRTAALDGVTMQDYHLLGLAGGAAGSSDVAHIRWGGCPYSRAGEFTGKEGFPVIAYKVTVDQTGRALASTKGFARRAQKDETIVPRNDVAAVEMLVENDPEYKDGASVLFNADDTTTTAVKDACLSADNGHNNKPPTKASLTTAEEKARREASEKDVEFVFSKVKGRFRILKLPIPYAYIGNVDNMFFTCLGLHNMLHAFEGIDVFEANVDWGHEDGLHDTLDFDAHMDESWVGGSTESEEK